MAEMWTTRCHIAVRQVSGVNRLDAEKLSFATILLFKFGYQSIAQDNT